MAGFSLSALIGGLIFSGIGFVAFTYGKRVASARRMIQGAALMGYAYFAPGTGWIYAIGTGLTAWLLLTRDG